MREGYPPDWAHVSLMVSPTGEIHAIGGEQTGADPLADNPYTGLERIKRFWTQNAATAKPVDRAVLERAAAALAAYMGAMRADIPARETIMERIRAADRKAQPAYAELYALLHRDESAQG